MASMYKGGGNSYREGGNTSTRDLNAKDLENLYEQDRIKINEQLLNQQKIQSDMKYKIFNVKDLLSEIQYEGVRKGTKTEAYLENVIESINRTGKYRWVQFFQLVDVFYVVVELKDSKSKNTQEEIKDHYEPAEEVKEAKSEKGTLTGEKTLVSSDPVSLKTAFPWKDKK